jgi:hypothetical protein
LINDYGNFAATKILSVSDNNLTFEYKIYEWIVASGITARCFFILKKGRGYMDDMQVLR